MSQFRKFLQVLLVVVVASLAWSSTATAHQTALSTMKVDVEPADKRVDVRLTMEPTDLTDHLEIDPDGDGFLNQDELAEVKPRLGEYIAPRLQAFNEERACPVVTAEFVDTGRLEPTMTFRKVFECEEPLRKLGLSNTVLVESPGGYTHYAKIVIGQDVHTTVFNAGSSSYEFEVEPVDEVSAEPARAEAQSFWDVAPKFTWQGILHIVLGLDHVLFVLCLLLAAREIKRLIAVVTTFTVAHSITLALSTLEIVVVPAAIVEPLIALSIAWAAVEIILGREPGDYLYALTFAFGLLHGFGFSYVLREVGLPADALTSALFTFNVGVELGQIAIVALAYPVMKWAEDRDWGGMAFRVVGGGILAISVYWLVERVIAAF
ncbi:MAG: HupE/UreJ family protein [Myxococcota bacterium]